MLKNHNFSIYLDNAASTPIDSGVAAKLIPFLAQPENTGNPSSNHAYGRTAAQAIEQARAQVASCVQAKPDAIIFTSGATEANNLALKGFAYANRHEGAHIITCQTEHSSVLDPCRQLAKEGFQITRLPVNRAGLIDLTQLYDALRPETMLVSVMHVNNETGVIQDIAAIGALLKAKNIYFHVDAAQSVGKLPLDLTQLPVDLMTFSAHKAYGPKGVGALYINRAGSIKLQPLFHGGGQEQGLRSGTLPTHQIVGMGEAFALAGEYLAADNARIAHLSHHLWQNINELGGIYLNGDPMAKVPHILNIAIAGLEAKVLLPALKNLALATGSACHENRGGGSHVLNAMGIEARLINSSLRISLGRFTTENDINFALEKITHAVKLLRK